MTLVESESMGYVDNIKPESQSQQPLQDESMKVDPNNAASFNKQSSILSLTLDEIQLKGGKSFGSMNMDEFLANLWSVDENQVPPQPMLQNEQTNYTNGIANQTTLQRQAPLSVPATLCKKTVDEVWFEIQKEHNPNSLCHVRGPPQRAQTLGEMTLEEFLVQAGIVQGVPMSSQQGMVTAIQSNNNGNNTTCLDANFQMGHVLGIGFSAHPSLNGFATYQTFSQNKMLGGESSSNGTANENCHHGLMDSNGQKSKKRIIDGPLEIVVERRQRRMIKNRESAARSRARKQAYTVELELELNILKEENAKLKQVVEEIEQKRKQEVMNKKKTTMAQKKAFKLRTMRRTLSLSW